MASIIGLPANNPSPSPVEQFTIEYTRGYEKIVCFLMASYRIPIDLAEDLAQTAWMLAWERREQYRGESPFLFWVRSIARNTYRMFRKKRKMMPLCFDFGIAPQYQRQAEARADCGKLLNAIPAKEAELLQFRYLEGHSAAEAAKEYGITTEGNARIRILRALRSVRLTLV